jgi:hypothetical protein
MTQFGKNKYSALNTGQRMIATDLRAAAADRAFLFVHDGGWNTHSLGCGDSRFQEKVTVRLLHITVRIRDGTFHDSG